MKRSYPTDLTDAEWRCLEPHIPAPEGQGRPRIHTTREVLDAMFYVLKSGCPGRRIATGVGLYSPECVEGAFCELRVYGVL